MSGTFNYVDNMNTQTSLQYIANQHDKAIETSGRQAYIFPLDKKETELSEVYKEEKNGRVYLPHFTQRALYKSNTFLAALSAQNYTETEEALEMEFDFQRMVHNIHELKSNSAGKLIIINNSKIPLKFEINSKFTIKNNIQILYEKDLKGFTVYNFIDTVKKETKLVDFIYKGDSEELVFLDKVNFQLLPRRKYEIELNNSIYKNISDVINTGDVIITDRNRLYQVVGAYPRNDNYGQYIAWMVKLEIFNLAKADGLPNDYVELIKRNQYGFTEKIKI